MRHSNSLHRHQKEKHKVKCQLEKRKEQPPPLLGLLPTRLLLPLALQLLLLLDHLRQLLIQAPQLRHHINNRIQEHRLHRDTISTRPCIINRRFRLLVLHQVKDLDIHRLLVAHRVLVLEDTTLPRVPILHHHLDMDHHRDIHPTASRLPTPCTRPISIPCTDSRLHITTPEHRRQERSMPACRRVTWIITVILEPMEDTTEHPADEVVEAMIVKWVAPEVAWEAVLGVKTMTMMTLKESCPEPSRLD